MSDNTSIPKEIMDKIEGYATAEMLTNFDKSIIKQRVIFGYQLRQQEVSKLETLKRVHLQQITNFQSQLKAANETIEELRNEIQEAEPYHGWCDVQGCEKEGANGGGCWKETGYWTVCHKHSKEYREGKPQPKMKQYAIEREKTRDENGRLHWYKPLWIKNESALAELQLALIHEKEMRSKEADNYNKRIQELEAELRREQKVH